MEFTFIRSSFCTSVQVQGRIYQTQCVSVFVTTIGVRLKEQHKQDGGPAEELCSSLPPCPQPLSPLTSPLHAFMFTGAICEIQIDKCQSQPCLNGGRCHAYTDGFTCMCLPGFQGHRCEINTDECQEQPCRNGAPCVDRVNG